jgi:hypothetical protein
MGTISKQPASITTIMGAAILTLAEQSSQDVDLAGGGYEGSQVDVSVNFHVSGSKDAIVSVYAGVDTTYSQTPFWIGRIPFVASGGINGIPIIIKDVHHFKVTVKSDTGETNHGTATIRSRPWNWVSA